MSTQKEGRPQGFSSPACLMHETDDRYLGYAGRTEIVDFLQALLEAERAGALVCLESARTAGSTTQGQLLRSIRQDEARWCAMLAKHLKTFGQQPSTKIGTFYEKAMAVSDLKLRMDLLNRGQGWVVLKLRDMMSQVRDEGLHADLTEMLRSHEANIARVSAIEEEAR